MKILFIDDDQGLLDQAKYVLEREDDDFEVIPVQYSEDAFELLKKEEIDIIIADYKMPGIDGIELLKKIRQEGDEIPFIMFTGKGREEIAMEALNLGADRYLKKGGDPIAQYKVLAQAIKQEVSHKKTEMSIREMKTELESFKERYKALFECLKIPLLIIDGEGKIVLANKRFSDISKYRREELEGKKNWFQFVEKDDVERVKKIHRLKEIDKDLGQRGYKFYFVDKYGRSNIFYVTISEISGSEKSFIALTDLSGFDSITQELDTLAHLFLKDDFEDIKQHIGSLMKELFEGNSFKNSIKNWCLEETLILLIDIKNGASGKELMSLLNETFLMDLSSSIVYPKLHDLEERGILEVYEHIRTKEYKIKDEEKAKKLVQDKIMQLFGVYTIVRLLDKV